MALIGLENAHYAKLTKDNETGVTYDTPKRLPGAVSINENSETNTAELYADNRLWATAQVFSKGDVELVLADLPLATWAELCGHTVNEKGILVENAADVAPYVCIMGEGLKEDGKTKRYFKLLKGQCAKVGLDMNTKSNNPEFKTNTLKVTFMARQFDGNYKYVIDSTDENTTVTSGWYSAVE